MNICFFGDSICFGQGISIHKGWVTRISAALDEFSKEVAVPISVTNASVNGNTTRMALERMPYDVQSNQFDILIIQFGMNDCNYWKTDNGNPRVSPEAFKANLKEIIIRARSFGIEDIFLNTNHISCRDKTKYEYANCTYQESNHYYNCLIRQVSSEFKVGVQLIDIEKHFESISEDDNYSKYLLDDELHLGLVGHDVYFEYVYPKILKCVERQLKIK